MKSKTRATPTSAATSANSIPALPVLHDDAFEHVGDVFAAVGGFLEQVEDLFPLHDGDGVALLPEEVLHGIAVMLMYLILVMQFGSFLEPLAIMISLPLSLIGVMLALMITGTTINIMSLIGVILLMGIVAKNAILLIDFAKWAREKDGMPRREALIQAGAIIISDNGVISPDAV